MSAVAPVPDPEFDSKLRKLLMNALKNIMNRVAQKPAKSLTRQEVEDAVSVLTAGLKGMCSLQQVSIPETFKFIHNKMALRLMLYYETPVLVVFKFVEAYLIQVRAIAEGCSPSEKHHLFELEKHFIKMVKIYLERADDFHPEVGAQIFVCFKILQSFCSQFQACCTVSNNVFGGVFFNRRPSKAEAFIETFIEKCVEKVETEEKTEEDTMSHSKILEATLILKWIRWLLTKVGVDPVLVLVACVSRLTRLLSSFRRKMAELIPLFEETPWLAVSFKYALLSVFGDGAEVTEGFRSLFLENPRWRNYVLGFYANDVVPTRQVSADVSEVFFLFPFLGQILSDKVLLVLAQQGNFASAFQLDPLLSKLVKAATTSVEGDRENLFQKLFCAIVSALEGRTSSSDQSVVSWVKLVEEMVSSGIPFQGDWVFEVVFAVILFLGPGWSFRAKDVLGSIFSNPYAVERKSGAVKHIMLFFAVLSRLSEKVLNLLDTWLGFGFQSELRRFRQLQLSRVLFQEEYRMLLFPESGSCPEGVFCGNRKMGPTFEAIFKKLALASGDGKEWLPLLKNLDWSDLPPGMLKRLFERFPRVFFPLLSTEEIWNHFALVLQQFSKGFETWEKHFSPPERQTFLALNPDLRPESLQIPEPFVANVFSQVFAGDLKRVYQFFWDLIGNPSETSLLPTDLKNVVMEYYYQPNDPFCGRLKVLCVLAALASCVPPSTSSSSSKKRSATSSTAVSTQDPLLKLQKI